MIRCCYTNIIWEYIKKFNFCILWSNEWIDEESRSKNENLHESVECFECDNNE
jgi:hypothetical protein